MTFSFIPREKALYFNFWKVVLLRQYRIMKSEGEIRLWWDIGQHSLCFKCILISKTWVWMEARLKKRGRGRGCEERAERQDRKSTREESHKTMFSAAQPSVLQKGLPGWSSALHVTSGQLLQLLQKQSSGCVARLQPTTASEAPLCTVNPWWHRDLLGSVDRDQSISCIDFTPLVFVCCGSLNHTDHTWLC